MLRLIGIGLNPKQLTIEGLHAIQHSDSVYAENYTSAYSEGTIETLEGIIHQKITLLEREEIENKMEELTEKAQNQNIAILIFGNPLTATTHHSLIIKTKEKKIPTEIIPGISIFNYRGFTGLDEYRFGRTTTFVFPQEGYEPLSTFDIIVQNKKMGLHTHCLLDLHPDKKIFMSIPEAITWIEHASHAREIPIHDWIGIGLEGMGNKNQQIISGELQSLKKKKWGVFPQSLIICGNLTEYEKEAIRKMAGYPL